MFLCKYQNSHLELFYSCSYRHEGDYTLISIPLEIMDGEDTFLTDFIIENVIKQEEKVAAAKIEKEAKQRSEEIECLKKRLKELQK